MPTLETLNTEGFLFTEVACDWNILRADFGDGFEVAAIVGTPEGTRRWNIKIDALPGEESAAPLIAGLTRARYLWNFFRASKTAGDQPFWIELEDPDDGTRKQYLASFEDHKLTFSVLCARIYATGLPVKQRRLEGVSSPVPVAAEKAMDPLAIQTLSTDGFLITETSGAWTVAAADFGDGLARAVLNGHAEGLRQWTIKIAVLPDDYRAPSPVQDAFILTEALGFMLTEPGGKIKLEQAVMRNLGPMGRTTSSGVTRAQYLWRFFRLSKAAGDQPFWFEVEDPETGTRKKFLACFADDELSYEILAARIYAADLVLRQRRLEGVASPVPV